MAPKICFLEIAFKRSHEIDFNPRRLFCRRTKKRNSEAVWKKLSRDEVHVETRFDFFLQKRNFVFRFEFLLEKRKERRKSNSKLLQEQFVFLLTMASKSVTQL